MVIGDVTGSGLPAAVIMGRMRSALRAYALESDDPATVLARLDRKMQHFEPGALATVAYAMFDHGLGRVRICSAGHIPRSSRPRGDRRNRGERGTAVTGPARPLPPPRLQSRLCPAMGPPGT